MGFHATARSSAAAVLVAGSLLGPLLAQAEPTDSLPAPPSIPRAAAGWETLATGLPEEARLRLFPGFRYNRVDGATPGGTVAFQNEQNPAPLLYAGASYATGRDRFLGAAGFEFPIGNGPWLRVGADAFRRTASEDVWIVSEPENTLFALVARTDYRDYYEATGGAGHVIWEPGRDVAIEGGIRIQNESSLPTRVRFSIFGKDDRFRPNPPVEAGDEGLLTLSARLGPERVPLTGGTRGTIRYERAGGTLMGRDFDYGRVHATFRALHRFSRRMLGRARAQGGSTREGTLPPQKVWHLGGIGTLHAHDYKALSGDQFFLVNTEYLVRVRKRFFPFTFLDWGAAWFGTENLDRQRPALDGGVGFRIGEDPIAVTVARDLQRSDAPLRVGVRLGGSF